jgi:hypothetical protein
MFWFLFYDKRSVGKMVFESLFLISVRNVDLQTGLNIVDSISKEFTIRSIFIKRGLGRLPQGSLREPEPKVREGVYAWFDVRTSGFWFTWYKL